MSGHYLGGIAYALGEIREIASLEDDPAAKDAAEILAAVGVTSFSRLSRQAAELIAECATRSTAECRLLPSLIDTVLVVTESYATLRKSEPRAGETEFWAARNRLLDIFGALGIGRARYFSSSFGGSSNFTQALYLAVSLQDAGRAERILIVCADAHPDGVTRYMADSVAITGDGVASCLLSNAPITGAGPSWRLEHVGVTPYLVPPNPKPFGERVLDMYRATKVAAAECYEATGRQPQAYDHLILNNYNRLTSEVFARLLGIGVGRTFTANLGRTGHLPSCDTLVNLADLSDSTAPRQGEATLVFVNGPAGCATLSLATELSS